MIADAFDVYDCELRGTRLVEASAGTGKTWALCGLFLRLLLEQQRLVSSILVVTFTNAATAELRDRIRARICETLARLRGDAPADADPFVDRLLQGLREQHGMADDAMVRQLELALHSFDEASIFTIHGFCQRALADMPLAAGQPMALALLADDTELQLRVAQDFWRRGIAGAALSPALADHLLDCRDSPETLRRLLARRLAKPLAQLRWPPGLDNVAPPPSDDELLAAHARARATWAAERAAVIAIVDEALPRLNGGVYKPASVATACASWDELLARADGVDSLQGLDKLDLLSAARLVPKKDHAPPAAHAFFDQAAALLALHAARDEALALQRLRLLRDWLDSGPQALRDAKKAQRVIAFDDMLANLHRCLAASGGAALAALLRQRFGAALIDEFQDTDPLQYAIFDAIYAGSDAPVCLVGDPKQAIYSFRHADLHTYLRAKARADAHSTLADNQRSSRELLAAQNALFGANLEAFLLDGLRYQPVAFGDKPRTAFSDRSAAPRAALQLWQLPCGDDGQLLPKALAVQAALGACAGEIVRLINAGRAGEIRLGERELRAGDIAVLVRSHAHGRAMRRALAQLGVASVELSQASLYDSAEAADIERLLAALLEPTRMPLLRAALATELMGLDAAALQALSLDEAALLDWVNRFAAHRETWMQQGIAPMMRRWMRAEGVSGRLLARADGERRLTNLLHLIECLNEAALDHPGPEALLRWLQRQRREHRHDDAAQLRLESDRDLVQVVTIHKSKGLEYPVVFCPLLWDGHPGRRTSGEGLEYHDGGDAVFDFRTPDKAEKLRIDAQLALQRDAETVRLIYVALTRAVQRCYLVVGTYVQGKGASAAQSCRARLHWLAAGAGMSPAAWQKSPRTSDDIDAAWAALAREHSPAIALQPLPTQAAEPLAPQDPTAECLAALPPPARIPRGWRIGSYSSLVHGARHEAAARDHDLRVPDAADDSDKAAPPADDILAFPRGPVAGECLHAVFERIDFSNPAGWAAAVDTALQRHAQALPGGRVQPAWPCMLLRVLHEVLHTPLADGLRLCDVPPAQRQTEMEFHLPAPRLDAQALGQWLRRQNPEMPVLGFGTLSGYLRGFIDLVFEHGGRYYLLDWKSNHLGDKPQHYAEPALGRVMQQQGYQLQGLLYALALHRHLQQRLAGYRHAQHFGGVFYLFVRGVRPHWTQSDGSPCGVHLQRPALQDLQALAALLDDARPAR